MCVSRAQARPVSARATGHAWAPSVFTLCSRDLSSPFKVGWSRDEMRMVIGWSQPLSQAESVLMIARLRFGFNHVFGRLESSLKLWASLALVAHAATASFPTMLFPHHPAVRNEFGRTRPVPWPLSCRLCEEVPEFRSILSSHQRTHSLFHLYLFWRRADVVSV